MCAAIFRTFVTKAEKEMFLKEIPVRDPLFLLSSCVRGAPPSPLLREK